jgi:hypothetical protein
MPENDFQTVQDLYNFFEPIPEDKWTVGERTDYLGRHCILGHLDTVLNPQQYYGVDTSVEVVKRILPTPDYWGFSLEIVNVNNSNPKNPKQAVLDYLKSKMT